MPNESQRVFAYCSYLEHKFIDFDLLNKLFPNDEDQLQDSVKILQQRGLIEEEAIGEREGCRVTHVCLQTEMKHFYHLGRDRENDDAILTRICLALRGVIACDRHVRREERIDLEFKQVKHVVAQLEMKKTTNLSNELHDLYTELNEKLGYFYLFYEINYEKALACFEQVNEVMTKRHKNSVDLNTSNFFPSFF